MLQRAVLAGGKLHFVLTKEGLLSVIFLIENPCFASFLLHNVLLQLR